MSHHKNTWCYLLFLYFGIFFAFSLVFVLLFHTPLFHFEKVLFYRGMMLLALTILLSIFICILGIHFGRVHHGESVVAAIIISVALNLVFFVMLPVTIDRSVTSYLLTSLNSSYSSQSCKGLTEKQLQEQLIDGYIIKNNAIPKRVNEQKIINFINVKNQCLQITQKGQLFLQFSLLVRKIYAF